MTQLRPAPQYPEPPTTAQLWVYERKTCKQCNRRRQCLQCVCCEEYVCRDCLWKTKPAHDTAEPACDLCVKSSQERYY